MTWDGFLRMGTLFFSKPNVLYCLQHTLLHALSTKCYCHFAVNIKDILNNVNNFLPFYFPPPTLSQGCFLPWIALALIT